MKQYIVSFIPKVLSSLYNSITTAGKLLPKTTSDQDSCSIMQKSSAELALHYYQTEDYLQALKYAQLSANVCDAKGQYILGLMYHNGDGVTQNHKEAYT